MFKKGSDLNNQTNILQGKDDGIISSAKNENSINKAWKFVKTNYCIKGIICILLSTLLFSYCGECNMPSTAIFANRAFLLIFCLWLIFGLWSLSLVFFFTSIFRDKIIYKVLAIFGIVISFLSLILLMSC